MLKVVGIDPSLTSTGLACITHAARPGGQPERTRLEWAVHTRVVASKPAGSSLTARRARLAGIVDEVRRYVLGADLVCIEGPSFGSRGAGTWERAWLWGALVDMLLDSAPRVVEVPPTVRALFAAGKGNAAKAAVTAAMARLYPTLLMDPGGEEDQWDALALASIGAALAGMDLPFPMAEYRARALAKVA